MVPGVFFVDYLLDPLFVFSTVLQIRSKKRIKLNSALDDVSEADAPSARLHKAPSSCFDVRTEARLAGDASVFRHKVPDLCAWEQGEHCTLLSYWEEHIQQPVPPQGALWFAQGARFSVTAEQIRRRPRSGYERLLASVNISRDPSAGYFLEVLWWYILTSPTDVACPQPPNIFTPGRLKNQNLELLLTEAAQLAPDAAARVQSILAGEVPRTELEVVLCRHREDPSWAAPLAPVLTVYNTGDALPNTSLPAGAQVIALPNVGRESGAYLHHIVSRYDSLAELMVFSHAGLPASGLRSATGGGHMVPGVFFLDYLLNPLFVFTTVLHLETKKRIRLDSFGVVSDYADQPEVHVQPASCFDVLSQGRNLGSAGIFRNHVASLCAEEQTPHCSLEGYWEQYLQQPVPPQGALWFAQGARFSATAEQIRRRPRAEYERLLASVNGSVDPAAGYFLEVLWWYVLTSPTDVACPQPPNMFGLAKKPADPVNAGTDYTHQPDYSDDEAEAEAVD